MQSKFGKLYVFLRNKNRFYLNTRSYSDTNSACSNKWLLLKPGPGLWTRTLDPDPGPGPWTWTLDPDLGPWTQTLKKLDPENPGP